MLYVNNNLIKVEKLGLGSIALPHLCIQNGSSDIIWNIFAVIGTVLVLGIQKQRTQTHSFQEPSNSWGSILYLANHLPLKIFKSVLSSHPLLKNPSFFRWRSSSCSVLSVAPYSLSHGQMGLSPLNVLFKRLWGQEQYLFISESLLLLSENGCSEEVLRVVNLKAGVYLTLIHLVSFPSWERGSSTWVWLWKE